MEAWSFAKFWNNVNNDAELTSTKHRIHYKIGSAEQFLTVSNNLYIYQGLNRYGVYVCGVNSFW